MTVERRKVFRGSEINKHRIRREEVNEGRGRTSKEE